MSLIFASNLRLPSEKAASLQSMTMCAEFAKLTPVKLVVPRRRNHLREDPFVFYKIAKTFAVEPIFCLDLPVLQKISERLWFYILNLSFAIAVFFWLMRNLKSGDTVYTRDEQLLTSFSFWKTLTAASDGGQKISGVRFFWECHAIPKAANFAKIKNLNIVRIVALTQAAKDHFIQNGFDADQILVAHDGVHLEPYLKAKPLTLPNPTFTYVGRFKTLGEEKGIRQIIEAAAILPRDALPHFLFVGGPLEVVAEYEQLIHELKLPRAKFEFRDRVANTEVPTFLKGSDALLMPFPRLPHYEINMSPLKMFEYMASGKPIITSDLKTIREVLDDHTAVFCQPDDPKSLARAMEFVLQNPVEVKRRAEAAFTHVQNYTWTKRAEQIWSWTTNSSSK